MSTYEDRARDELRSSLREYANRAIGCRKTKQHNDLEVHALLVTSSSLDLDYGKLEKELAEQLAHDLPGSVLSVNYVVDRTGSPPSVSVQIQPPPCPDPELDTLSSFSIAPEWFKLVLSYVDYCEMFHLAPVAQWVPLGRAVHRSDRQTTIRIADQIRAVPRGALLRLRRFEAQLQICRTRAGRDYRVELNGLELAPDAVRELPPAGTLSYRDRAGEATHLNFQIYRGQ